MLPHRSFSIHITGLTDFQLCPHLLKQLRIYQIVPKIAPVHLIDFEPVRSPAITAGKLAINTLIRLNGSVA